ncbi:hypothetical protein [Salinibacter ruber]|uniref:hypothetical protein n=1 Tax=Salinibacter ruber TaxID=146919 RepID=UPI002168A517|nr:hypothetical protein [Salinibacter ruber]MCS4150723.1 transposase [Salinibacter ruber]
MFKNRPTDRLIDWHVDQLQNAHGFDYVVADSGLYSAGHIQDLDEAGTKFVTRVPGTLNEARQAIQNPDLADLKPLSDGYRAREKISEYGDVKQRGSSSIPRLLLIWPAQAQRASGTASTRQKGVISESLR